MCDLLLEDLQLKYCMRYAFGIIELCRQTTFWSGTGNWSSLHCSMPTRFWLAQQSPPDSYRAEPALQDSSRLQGGVFVEAQLSPNFPVQSLCPNNWKDPGRSWKEYAPPPSPIIRVPRAPGPSQSRNPKLGNQHWELGLEIQRNGEHFYRLSLIHI